MGRAAIDEEAIRALEANNPDVEFDWPQILKGHVPADAGEPPRKTRDRAAVPPASRPEAAAPQPPDIEPATPAEARLGSQGLARLRARYAELMTRIGDRVAEAERQEELKGIAERLNPDAWITDADVTAGLDAYEPTYEMVRSALPPRRKPGEPV